MRALIIIKVENLFTIDPQTDSDLEMYIRTFGGDRVFTTTAGELYNMESTEEVALKIYESITRFYQDANIDGLQIEPYLDIYLSGSNIHIEANVYNTGVFWIYVGTLSNSSALQIHFKNMFADYQNPSAFVYLPIEVLDFKLNSYRSSNDIPAHLVSGWCGKVQIDGSFKKLNPSGTNNGALIDIIGDDITDVITSSFERNANMFMFVVNRTNGEFKEFSLIDYLNRPNSFTVYIPSKLSIDDFEFEVIKSCGQYVLIVKRNKSDLILWYDYGSGFQSDKNMNLYSISYNLNLNTVITIKDDFGCQVSKTIKLIDYYDENEEIFYISSENSIRYITDKLGSDGCCFDKEDELSMNEFNFSKVNINKSQIFTTCDGLITQIKSSREVFYKTINCDGIEIEFENANLVSQNMCSLLGSSVSEFSGGFLLGVHSQTKEVRVFFDEYTDVDGESVTIVNGVPNIFLNKIINMFVIFTKKENVGGAIIDVQYNESFLFYNNQLKFDDDLGLFYLSVHLIYDDIVSVTATANGSVKDYNVYEFSTSMQNINKIIVKSGDCTVKSDSFYVIDKNKFNNLIKIHYWNDEDTTIDSTSYVGVVNLFRIFSEVESEIKKDTVFLDDTIINRDIKTYHTTTINFEAIKIQLFRSMIDAISNKFLTVNGTPMVYKSHTSETVGKSDLVKFSISFYIDHKRGVYGCKNDVSCGTPLKLNYYKEYTTESFLNNDNTKIIIN